MNEAEFRNEWRFNMLNIGSESSEYERERERKSTLNQKKWDTIIVKYGHLPSASCFNCRSEIVANANTIGASCTTHIRTRPFIKWYCRAGPVSPVAHCFIISLSTITTTCVRRSSTLCSHFQIEAGYLAYLVHTICRLCGCFCRRAHPIEKKSFEWN